jgi:hypothetical protein
MRRAEGCAPGVEASVEAGVEFSSGRYASIGSTNAKAAPAAKQTTDTP